jgi:hypothetical protein
LNVSLIFILAIPVSCSALGQAKGKIERQFSEVDSVERTDTLQIQSPYPPYAVRDTIIKRRVALTGEIVDETDTLNVQRPYPPYDYHDTIIKRRVPRKK